jgi:hypothetical protein
MEEIRLGEVEYNTGRMSKHVEFLVKIARRVFSTGCLGVGVAERSI